MYREGHYGAALIVYAPAVALLIAFGYLTLALLGGAVVVGGAMLPDIDQRIPGVTHRGITHTVWFAIVVGVAVGVVATVVGPAFAPVGTLGMGLFGSFVGTLTVVAHILADALTPAGVRPFAPVRTRKYTLDVTTAANPLADYALLGIGAVTVGVAIVAGMRVHRALGS